MTEEQRKEIVKRINKDKNKIAYRSILEQMLQEQEQKTEVKKYLSLQKKYQELLKEQQFFDNSEKKIIDLEFIWALEENADKKIACNHEIWLYNKSYYISIGQWGENYLPCENEYHKKFAYNSYICLECGKEIQVIDWKNFEQTHDVLKNQSKKSNRGVHHYRLFFYETLYSHTVEESKQILKAKFNLDIEKGYIRTRKNNNSR